MGRTRRKKKHTQDISQSGGASQGSKIPKSFVIGRGKLPILLRNLEHDIRKLMSPHTALNLKESGKNTLKDFVHVAGPLGVTHLLILSNTQLAPYLRVGRLPHGPTLTFKIHSYVLAADIARAQARPRAPVSIFQSPPLVVLNGFGGVVEHLKLITIMFQNIFPVIDVNTVKLATCQRVLLLNYNKDTKLIDLRHYSISAQPVGVSRGICKLVQRKKLPDLSALSDVSEFITKSGYGSESEIENEASKVQLPDEYGRGNRALQQSAVKLHEVGPHMTLQLVKVEEGVCSGAILFHEYVKKSPEEIAAMKEQIERREALRKQRKAEQEANIQRKLLLKKRKNPKNSYEDVEQDNAKDDLDQPQSPDMDDADWYRQEVGEEPDEGFLSGASQKKVYPRRSSIGRSYKSSDGLATVKFAAAKMERLAGLQNLKRTYSNQRKNRNSNPGDDAKKHSSGDVNKSRSQDNRPGKNGKVSRKRRAFSEDYVKKVNKKKKTS